MKSRTEILVPLAAIQAVPIAVIAWYRLQRYAWYRYSAIVSIAKEKRLSKDLQESLKEKAIVDAQKDKEDFWSTINDYRQSGFKNDLIDNMIWAAIIALSLTILGRYIFKIITWVMKNKT